MQQTKNYKLNLIETSDTFSPDPLNENAQSLDSAMTTLRADHTTLAAQTAALAAGIGSGGKNARLTFGSYIGNDEYGPGSPLKLTFDFCPVLVFICSQDGFCSNSGASILMRDSPTARCDNAYYLDMKVTWLDNGIQWYGEVGAGSQNNVRNVKYYYIAIGY